MPIDRIHDVLAAELEALRERGTAKRDEAVITRALPAADGRGPRFQLAGHGDRPFLKMNSNSYLGLTHRRELMRAEEEAVEAFGTGPGAVRFISGTYEPHVRLEERLARFHGREAGMIFSSAYATVVSLLVPLITAETVVISDELNHNCIINAIRLSRPRSKEVYKHLDLGGLEAKLAAAAASQARRAIVVTDGNTTTQDFSLGSAPASACLTDTTQADFQTGVATNLDLAVSGNGFFTLSTGGALSYTRDGQFQLDQNGNVITAQGANLQVYPPLATGGFAKYELMHVGPLAPLGLLIQGK